MAAATSPVSVVDSDQDWSPDRLGPLGFRSPELVEQILESASAPTGVGFIELVATVTDGSDRWRWSTVESTVSDLVSFGAVRVRGRRRRTGPDERRVVATRLGVWWALDEFDLEVDDV